MSRLRVIWRRKEEFESIVQDFNSLYLCSVRIIEPKKNRKDNAYLIKVGIFFLVLSIFYKVTQVLSENILIKPILSTLCEPQDFRRDLFISVSILFITGFVIYKKVIDLYFLSFKHSFLIFAALAYFILFFRYDYYYYEDYLDTGLKLCDLLFIWIVLIADLGVNYNKSKELSEFNLQGFLTDESKSLGVSDGINDLIQKIIIRLKNTVTNESFTIGIVGEWGQGKTTFIKTFSENVELNYKNDFVQFEFNPWMYAKKDELTTQFLDEFATFLSQYHSGASKAVKNYSKHILSLTGKGIEGVVNTFTSLMESESPILEQIEEINTIIDQTNKKVIVYIDDLDRLNNEEILMVFKLIRNVANFKNTFFVLGYDKEVITKVLSETLKSKFEIYSEKIVQLEVYLKRTKNDNLKLELISTLKEKLNISPDKYKTALEHLNERPEYLKVECAIFNFRDINRFINVFLTNYRNDVIDEVDFIDFFNLQLLRYKYPILHDSLYYKKEFFLSNQNKERLLDFKKYYHLLDTNFPLKDDILTKFFISKENKDYVNQLLEALFSERKDPETSIWGTVSMVKLDETNRIRFVFSFDTYFEYSLQGNLSLHLFNKARQESYEEFLKKVVAWNEDSKCKSDLSYIFSRIKLNDIGSLEDFKKICKVSANLISNFEGTHEFGKLLNLLLFSAEDRNYSQDLVTIFGGKKGIEDFVMDIIAENDSKNGALIWELSKTLFHRGKFQVDQMSPLRERFLEYYVSRAEDFLQKESKFSFEILRAVEDSIKCQYFKTPIRSLDADALEDSIAKELYSKLRAFIERVGLDDFIWNGESSFIIENQESYCAFNSFLLSKIFGSIGEFIEVVSNGNSIYKEDILGFYRKYKDQSDKDSKYFIEYDFKRIFK